jgi:hypothetical protein
MSLKIPGSIKNEGLVYKKLKTPTVAANLFKLHTLAAFIGPRGSGKTNAAVLLARRYLDDHSINRIFIISPTIDSNRIFDILEPKEEDIYKNIHTCLEDLNTILSQVKLSVEEYEETKAYNKIYKKWRLYVKGKGPALTIPEFNLMENNNFKPREDIPRPSPLLIIDDMSHSDLYTQSKIYVSVTATCLKSVFLSLCWFKHLKRVFPSAYDKISSNSFYGRRTT